MTDTRPHLQLPAVADPKPSAAERKAARRAAKAASKEAERQVLLAAPVDRTRARNELRSNSTIYPVGRRGEYVFHLVAPRSDKDARAADIHGYDLKWNLTDDERADLADRLAKLDSSRAAPNPPPKPEPAWKSEPATAKQIAAMWRLGLTAPLHLTKGLANFLIYDAARMSRDIDRVDEMASILGEVARDEYDREFAAYRGDHDDSDGFAGLSREQIVAAFVTHMDAVTLGNFVPGTEHHAALETLYPDIKAFRLADAGWRDGDVLRWLVVCDWLADQDGGSSVADSIRTAIGKSTADFKP